MKLNAYLNIVRFLFNCVWKSLLWCHCSATYTIQRFFHSNYLCKGILQFKLIYFFLVIDSFAPKTQHKGLVLRLIFFFFFMFILNVLCWAQGFRFEPLKNKLSWGPWLTLFSFLPAFSFSCYLRVRQQSSGNSSHFPPIFKDKHSGLLYFESYGGY